MDYLQQVHDTASYSKRIQLSEFRLGTRFTRVFLGRGALVSLDMVPATAAKDASMRAGRTTYPDVILVPFMAQRADPLLWDHLALTIAIVAEAHDTEETENDPIAHAEINVIRATSKKLGKDLEGCILLTTHDLEEIIAHADRLIIMQDGKIIRDGAPVDIVCDLESFGVRKPCACRLGAKAESCRN